MNKHGLTWFVTIPLALVFILMALALAPAIYQFVVDARGPTTDTAVGLDCSNSSISNFDKASCVSVDYFTPFFVGALIFIGGAITVAKVIA